MFIQNNFFNRNNLKSRFIYSLGKALGILSIIWFIFSEPDTSRFVYISILVLLLLGTIYCLVLYPIVNNVENGDVKSFKDLDITSIIPLVIFIIITIVIVIGTIYRTVK